MTGPFAFKVLPVQGGRVLDRGLVGSMYSMGFLRHSRLARGQLPRWS